jgi:predicted  nucleic acid-binding Zn-ribbon protein
MINNPQTPIVIPEELQKEIEKNRQQLSVNELELQNIRKSRANEEYQIRQLLKRKEEIENAIEDLNEKIPKLEAKQELIEKSLVVSSQNMEKMDKLSKDYKEIWDKKNKDFSDREHRISQQEMIISDKLSDIKIKEEKLKKQGDKISVFSKNINEVIKNYAS